MGLFRVKIEIGHPVDRRFEEIEAVVDTGAFCSMFPASASGRMGVAPDIEREFTLADGRKQTYPMGEGNVPLGRAGSAPAPSYSGRRACAFWARSPCRALGLFADTTHHRLIPAPELLLVRAEG